MFWGGGFDNYHVLAVVDCMVQEILDIQQPTPAATLATPAIDDFLNGSQSYH